MHDGILVLADELTGSAVNPIAAAVLAAQDELATGWTW